MRGRRVAEIACGSLEQFIITAGEMALTDFLIECADLSNLVIVEMTADWHVGKRFVVAELRLRCKSLPMFLIILRTIKNL